MLVREVLEFVANPVAPDWTPAQHEVLKQDGLFENAKPLDKLPFDFRLRWRDGESAEHDSKFIAWEVGQTWRGWRHKYADPIPKMREKWMTDLFGPTRDIWFFMGNFAEHRQVFGVCGAFVPPKEKTASGTLWANQQP